MSSLLLIPLVFAALFTRVFFWEPFNIPAGSMVPTLLVGDYMFVSKAAYGYSRYSFPFSPPMFAGRIFGTAPHRGDVVVFRLPRNPKVDYVKRIVGLPGDRLQLRAGQLYLNGELVPRRSVGDYAYPETGGRPLKLHDYVESLPGEGGLPAVEYHILKFNDNGPLDNTPVYEVPPGHYFALGDNRDNSQDSRILSAVGYIPDENLIGRALFIFYSTDGAASRDDRAWMVVH